MLYSLVLLDGQEIHNLSLEEVKEMFFGRRINQDSLVWCVEDPRWQMLKRAFDLNQWVNPDLATPTTFGASPAPEPSAPPNPFAPPAALATPAAPVHNPFQASPEAGPAEGYTQNNQSETYYQAETNYSGYDVGKASSDFGPSRYNQPAPHQAAVAAPSLNASAAQIEDPNQPRRGARFAAAFVVLNVILFTIFTALLRRAAGPEAADASTPVWRTVLTIVVDFSLAWQLFTGKDFESARKWVLARTYIGFVAFGLILAASEASKAGLIFGVIDFALAFFYMLSIGLILHGKGSPSTGRVIFATGTFACHAALLLVGIGIMSIAALVPRDSIAKANARFLDEYRTEGTSFRDEQSGAEIELPEGWTFVSAESGAFEAPGLRVAAAHRNGKRMSTLQLIPIPQNREMKSVNPSEMFDYLAEMGVESARNGAEDAGDDFREIARSSTTIGRRLGRVVSFERESPFGRSKGQLIVTYDDRWVYILQLWADADDFTGATPDFAFFQSGFTIPETPVLERTQSARNAVGRK